MKYVCLVYYAEAEVGQMSPEDWLALNYECVAFGDDIAASGHRLGGAALVDAGLGDARRAPTTGRECPRGSASGGAPAAPR